MKPVVLLLPGLLNDAGVWDGVVAALEGEMATRALPAFTQDSVAAMARAAWQAVADLPPEAPLLVAGFSMGGYVALEMLSNPERAVAGLALVSTSARPESPEAAAAREKGIAALRADFGRAVEGILQWTTHAASPELAQRLRAMMHGVGAELAIRQSRAVMARADRRALLARLTMPVEVLCGRQDRTVPAALSEELAALLPQARLHLVGDAGHMLPAERPQAVADAIVALSARASAPAATNHKQGDE